MPKAILDYPTKRVKTVVEKASQFPYRKQIKALKEIIARQDQLLTTYGACVDALKMAFIELNAELTKVEVSDRARHIGFGIQSAVAECHGLVAYYAAGVDVCANTVIDDGKEPVVRGPQLKFSVADVVDYSNDDSESEDEEDEEEQDEDEEDEDEE
jgi:hypothetical protein